MHIFNCEKLYSVEGCFKFESIKNVDGKVRRYLGLENAYTEDESIKVSYEYGIYSAFVPGKTALPCFRHKAFGSRISFRVPSHPNGSRIIGLNVCFMSTSTSGGSVIDHVKVSNKSKALVWKYVPTISQVAYEIEGAINYVWLSLWRSGNLLDDGDEIDVSISLFFKVDVVEECCVNLVYDDEEEEMDAVLSNHRISWRDRMPVEVSDYVHTGKTYDFAISHSLIPRLDDLRVDWWGLKKIWTCRDVEAGRTAEFYYRSIHKSTR